MDLEELTETYRGRRVLITGGLGFIGSNLARALVAADARVTLIDSMVPTYGGHLFNIAGIEERVRINISDVRDPYSLHYLVRGQDVIFNLAGQTSHLDSMEDPSTDLEINCASQLSLLEACRRDNLDARIVFASTRQIYGRPDALPVPEDHPIRPVDVNGIHKAAGERYHLLYGEVYRLGVGVLRLTNTYGPRMRVRDARQTFLGAWLRIACTGGVIQVFGDGTQRRDFNYVDDAVSALLLVGSRSEALGQVYNLGAPDPISLEELAKLLVELNSSGRYEKVPFPADRKPIDIGDYFADFSRIERELGWRPRVSLREGLMRSLEYYRKHGERYWNGADGR